MSTEGDQLFAKAEKKASGGGGWFSSSSSKYEDAGDLFQQAGNRYKIEGKWRESGIAFEKEADMRLKANESNDAVNAYHNAAKSYKKTDPEAAVTALHRCIKLLLKNGSFRQAADREKEIAAVFAQDNLDLGRARDSYIRAGEIYKQEEANATANQCFQQAAEISGELGDYGKAVELFEVVGDWMLSSPLTKYSVKSVWQRAALSAMAMGDLVTCQRLLESFSRQDVTFPSTREAKFVVQLMDACEQGDLESFTGAIFEYDKTSRLDNWTTAVLLRIKKGLEQEQEALT